MFILVVEQLQFIRRVIVVVEVVMHALQDLILVDAIFLRVCRFHVGILDNLVDYFVNVSQDLILVDAIFLMNIVVLVLAYWII